MQKLYAIILRIILRIILLYLYCTRFLRNVQIFFAWRLNEDMSVGYDENGSWHFSILLSGALE